MKHFHCKWDSRLYYCLKIEKVKKLGRRQSRGIDQPEETASRGRNFLNRQILRKVVQFLRFDERPIEVHKGGMQRLCCGLPHERSYTGFAVGKIHAPRMHILPKMRRRLHNKSHQTKNTINLNGRKKQSPKVLWIQKHQQTINLFLNSAANLRLQQEKAMYYCDGAN